MKDKPLPLALGLTVFNRYRLLSLSAASLRPLVSAGCKLYVINDGSTEYSEKDIRELLPNAIIQTNVRNSGRADYAAAQLATLLVQQDAAFVAMLDSDLMYHASFVPTVLAAMPYTDGIMTTLNSDRHVACSNRRISIPNVNNSLIEKEIIGNAGSVWSRDFLAEVLQEVPVSSTWDWDYSKYLRGKNKKIFSVERSVVQHLGFWVGQNSSRMNGDWGLGYPSLGQEEASIIAEMLFLGTKRALAHTIEENSTKYISANHFQPRGRIQGRDRIFRMQEPLCLTANVFLEPGYHYFVVDATARKSIAYPFKWLSRGQLELSVIVNEKTMSSARVSVSRLSGSSSKDALRLEFDNEVSGPARIELRYCGPSTRRELHLKGVFIDQI